MSDLSQLSGSNQVLTLEHLNSPSSNSPFSNSSILKLIILTFNLAKYVQLNEIKGSESITVEKCQLTYPHNKGLSEDGQLSQCTLNASDLIKSLQCDLMGFQECVEPSFSRMVQRIKQESKPYSRNYQTIGYDSVQIVYDEDKLGNGIMLNKSGLHIIESTRLMIVVWFPQTKILAINLHAPHDFDSEKEITNTFNSINISEDVKPERIVMMGDFNDSYRQPLTEITFLDMKLKQHLTSTGKPLQTCCTDSNYQWIGDYIFDSDYFKNGYYGIPGRMGDSTGTYFQRNDPEHEDKILMSDHHPVIYSEYY